MKVAFILMTMMFLLSGQRLMAQADTLWYGHQAFGDGRYDEAIDACQAAIDEGSTWTWLPDLITSVQIRRDLGNIIPADTHHIMVVYVVELNEITGTDALTSVDVTSEQKATWQVYFDVFRETIESFSGGNWTVTFDSIDAVSTYQSGSNLKPDNPDHLDIGDQFYQTMSNIDSYITFSNTRSPAMGLARQYPYLNGVIYGPHRGMAAINAGTHGYGTLLHEFFHIVEWVSNAISPTHGFEAGERDNFPDWTGETEFDYYRWHFSETLAAMDWQRLNHRTRWIPFNNELNSLETIKEAYLNISLSDRQTADTLYKEGKALVGTDPEQAAIRWQNAILLSPYHIKSLVELYDYYRFTSPDEPAAQNAKGKLDLIRKANDFYIKDSLNADDGVVVAKWHRENIGTNWSFTEWDVTRYMSKTGCYDFTFYYTDGFKALDIDSVFLVENENKIALDDHVGFSGNVKTDITYQLNIPAYNSKSSYTLMARVKGNGGSDSNGQIHFKLSQGDCIQSIFLEAPNEVNSILSSDAVLITWNDVSTNEEHFVIERKLNGENQFSIIDTLENDIVEFIDRQLSPSFTATYRVKATTSDGSSQYSPETSTTVDGTPTELTATQIPRAIKLEWKDNSINETHFVIEYSMDGAQTFSELATVPANMESYTYDYNGNEVPVYRIYAANDMGNSDYSANAELVVLGLENSVNTANIYPNPVKTELTIDFQLLKNASSVMLMDISGKIVMEHSFTGPVRKITINMADKAKGMYLLTVNSAGVSAQYKLWKE